MSPTMSDGEHSQPQPVRSGKVYPPFAADHHQARQATRLSPSPLPPVAKMMMAGFTVPVPCTEVAEETDAVTIGEAFQVAGTTFRMIQAHRPHQYGRRVIPGRVAAVMPQATEANMRHCPDDDADADGEKINKATMLKDVVGSATDVLPANKVTTREDADKVATTVAQNAGGDGELTRSVQSRSELIRNLLRWKCF
uniref:SMP domain-containing protein n=1 Tax=Oryza punctata TaxID=4537 RepID=A0A0E0JJ41_ORYPU